MKITLLICAFALLSGCSGSTVACADCSSHGVDEVRKKLIELQIEEITELEMRCSL